MGGIIYFLSVEKIRQKGLVIIEGGQTSTLESMAKMKTAKS